jgi:TorA maturation chaperone TorD
VACTPLQHARPRIARKLLFRSDPPETPRIVVGSDVQAEARLRRLAAEDFANLFVKNDRGEMVPYSSFLQLKKKQGLNEIDR